MLKMFINDMCLFCHLLTKESKCVSSPDDDGIIIEQKLKDALSEDAITSYNTILNFKPETSKHICTNCLKSLNEMQQFKKQCQKNLSLLSVYINKIIANYQGIILPDTVTLEQPRDDQQQNNELPGTVTQTIEDQLKNKKDPPGTVALKKTKEDQHQIKNELETPYIDTTDIEMPVVFAESLQPISEMIGDDIEYDLHTEVNIKDDPLTMAAAASSSSNDRLENITTNNIVQEYIPDEIRELTGEKPVKCSVCTRTPMGENLYKCGACDKSYHQILTLINHVRTHSLEKPYRCSICEKGFNRKDSLSDHLKRHRRHHTGERPFECDVCQKRFILLENLAKHKQTHEREKPHACPDCGKRFRHKYSMDMHRRVHSNIRPYKCKLCTWSFNQNEHLNTHMKTHTGERPYACTLCLYRAALKSSLRSHMRRIHKVDGKNAATLDMLDVNDMNAPTLGKIDAAESGETIV